MWEEFICDFYRWHTTKRNAPFQLRAVNSEMWFFPSKFSDHLNSLQTSLWTQVAKSCLRETLWWREGEPDAERSSRSSCEGPGEGVQEGEVPSWSIWLGGLPQLPCTPSWNSHASWLITCQDKTWTISDTCAPAIFHVLITIWWWKVGSAKIRLSPTLHPVSPWKRSWFIVSPFLHFCDGNKSPGLLRPS